MLSEIAFDSNRPEQVRAEALVGLATEPATDAAKLIELAAGSKPALRTEALRGLIGAELSADQQAVLKKIATDDQSSADAVARLLKQPFTDGRPDLKDTAAWLELLSGKANAEDGRRVFFNSKLAGCARCHRVAGHGQSVGPDLSLIGSTDRRHILESILQPSLTVAPHFQVWQMSLEDGQVKTGMLVHTQLDEYTYVDAQGKRFNVRTTEITESKPAPTSIMPANLVEMLTDQELRNLLEFLATGR
jgi:putative heme-binding domain-containing protein